MDNAEQLGTFAINVTQEHLQDLFDIECAMDQLVEGLMDEEVPPYVWEAISAIRTSLDTMQFRTTITPSIIHRFAPKTHQSLTTTAEKE